MREPTELELLIPWYVAGTLDAEQMEQVQAEMARDPNFAAQVADAVEEAGEVRLAAEALGQPSAQAHSALMAAIDGEPARSPGLWARISGALDGFGLSARPARLAFAAALAAICVQAVFLATPAPEQAAFETASGPAEGGVAPDHVVLVTFVPQATMADVSTLVTTLKGDVISGPKGGYFRVSFASEDAARAAVLQFTAAQDLVGFAVLED
ncbi:MAG: hypothetical protein AAFR93_12165 [Pseudomonadota bacterium]